MSVFNKTYENLLENRSMEVEDLNQVIEFMRKLFTDGKGYTITTNYDWWNKVDIWLIELDEELDKYEV